MALSIDFLDNVNIVILDEIHFMANRERGARVESTRRLIEALWKLVHGVQVETSECTTAVYDDESEGEGDGDHELEDQLGVLGTDDDLDCRASWTRERTLPARRAPGRRRCCRRPRACRARVTAGGAAAR